MESLVYRRFGEKVMGAIIPSIVIVDINKPEAKFSSASSASKNARNSKPPELVVEFGAMFMNYWSSLVSPRKPSSILST